MAATLHDTLLSPEIQPKVVADGYTLVEQEVHDMSGISGAAVKVAYKTVTTFMPGHVRFMVESLMPRMIEELDPYWAGFNAAGGSDFSDYLTKRADEVSESLLSVTDERAAASGRPTVIKAYRSVRGGAAKHVRAALPRLGQLVVKYAG